MWEPGSASKVVSGSPDLSRPLQKEKLCLGQDQAQGRKNP